MLVGGIVYEVIITQDVAGRAPHARVVELCGVVVAFGSIYGAVALVFYRRRREEAADAAAQRNSSQ